jgi:hypothetical protein
MDHIAGRTMSDGAEEHTEEQGLFTTAAVSRNELVAHEAPLLAIQSADR